VSAALTPSQLRMLHILADGQRHSGEELALSLGVSRAAIWKQMAKLKTIGLHVEATRGSGYLLPRAIDLLDKADIRSGLSADLQPLIANFEVYDSCASTNQILLDSQPPETGQVTVCMAEHQSDGRGRRGRSWVSPFGGGLCLSIGWSFECMPKDLSALTLSTGVATRDALFSLTGLDIRLKWPNDLVCDHKKLGGMLLELRAESQGPCFVVIGIGINVSIRPDALEQATSWPNGAIDLYAATQGNLPSRNRLAASFIEAVVTTLREYDESGFRKHHAQFSAVDYLRGREISVDEAASQVCGVAVGVDTSGALLLETSAGIKRIISGDISVRLAP
jgi:BirA family transcriptional regulator, biotin operon repressor / biotin---[acetyl-CoA-carboxylase] ligase